MIKTVLTYKLWTGLLLTGLLFCIYPVRAKPVQDTNGVVFEPIVRHANSKAVTPLKPAMTASPKTPAASFWVTFIAGLLGGFAALLMPCIFPMLPLTVGFFTKRQEKRDRGLRDALFYGLAIILIYTGLGMLVTLSFGPSALNRLATNGIFNCAFFLMLVMFAASFLGAFDLTLPNSWINKAEVRTDRSGFLGIFMMATVLALVSFSCTGPIIGTLLVQAASLAERTGPIAGMLGFSTALAMPFVLFALFPAWLDKLPKSGGWMQTLKVSLGFIELALSLKFLSNADLAYHWHWFDREVYLVLWILITGCFAMYLLGKIKLKHDHNEGIGIPRLFTGIILGAFSLYLVPGLWGAPLKAVAGFLPPQDTQDFDLYTALQTKAIQPNRTVKYAGLFHTPLGLPAFFDYDEGLAYAKKVHKPLLVDFTGHACVNCRKMETTVWPDTQVLPVIRDDYVLVQLYVDDKTAVAGDTTIGDVNSALQAAKFNSNSQPDYVLLDGQGNILVPPQGAVYDPAQYAAFLKSGLEAFNYH